MRLQAPVLPGAGSDAETPLPATPDSAHARGSARVAAGAGTDCAFWPEQVLRRHILGSIVQSEGSYVESLKRVLQVRLQGPLGRQQGGPQRDTLGGVLGGWGQF